MKNELRQFSVQKLANAEREWRPGTKEWRKFRRRERGRENKCVFTVHRVHGRPVGLAEIGGDMSAAALESPARSLRCSEGVIGRLLFLSPPLPSSASLNLFKLRACRLFLLLPSLPRALTCMTGTREERDCGGVRRGRGRERNGGEGYRWRTPDNGGRQKTERRSEADSWKTPCFSFRGIFMEEVLAQKLSCTKKNRSFNCILHCQMYKAIWNVAGILLPFSYWSVNESGCWCQGLCSSSTPKVVGSSNQKSNLAHNVEIGSFATKLGTMELLSEAEVT